MENTRNPELYYKKLYFVTIRNFYPLPLISNIIEHVKGTKYFKRNKYKTQNLITHNIQKFF